MQPEERAPARGGPVDVPEVQEESGKALFTQSSQTHRVCDSCSAQKRKWKCSKCGSEKDQSQFTTPQGQTNKRRRCDACADASA